MNTTESIGTRARYTPSAANKSRRKVVSVLAYIFTALSTVLALGLLLYLLIFLLLKGIGAINWEFLTSESPPMGNEGGGGIAASLTGTGMIVGIASLLGVPAGLLIGIYLSEIASPTSRFAAVSRMAVNTFTGLPSIIVGIFIYLTVVKTMGNFSALAGGIALSIIMIPIIARTAEDVMRLVPGSIREAGLALGIPTWRVILGVVVPAARAGIITGGVLAVARVAGETAPLILTALGNEFINLDPTKPTDELTLRILKYARGPFESWHQQAYGAAFVLVAAVAVGALLLRLTTRGRNIKIQ